MTEQQTTKLHAAMHAFVDAYLRMNDACCALDRIDRLNTFPVLAKLQEVERELMRVHPFTSADKCDSCGCPQRHLLEPDVAA